MTKTQAPNSIQEILEGTTQLLSSLTEGLAALCVPTAPQLSSFLCQPWWPHFLTEIAPESTSAVSQLHTASSSESVFQDSVNFLLKKFYLQTFLRCCIHNYDLQSCEV